MSCDSVAIRKKKTNLVKVSLRMNEKTNKKNGQPKCHRRDWKDD